MRQTQPPFSGSSSLVGGDQRSSDNGTSLKMKFGKLQTHKVLRRAWSSEEGVRPWSWGGISPERALQEVVLGPGGDWGGLSHLEMTGGAFLQKAQPEQTSGSGKRVPGTHGMCLWVWSKGKGLRLALYARGIHGAPSWHCFGRWRCK